MQLGKYLTVSHFHIYTGMSTEKGYMTILCFKLEGKLKKNCKDFLKVFLSATFAREDN